MTDRKDSDVLTFLQPELLTKDDLVDRIKKRCCRVQNLSLMSKERLVGLFRQVILPLPQRLYGTNRRGKMLSARRMKSGLEGKRKRGEEDEGKSDKHNSSKVFIADDRLKPPPDSSDPKSRKNSSYLDNIVINDRTKSGNGIREKTDGGHDGSSSSRKIVLKRPSSGSERSQPAPTSPTDSKRQRRSIQWP